MFYILLVIPVFSYAGIFFEPLVGVTSGEGTTSYENVESVSHDYSGQLLGAKIGYVGQSFFTSLGYDLNTASFNSENNILDAKDEISINYFNLNIGKIMNSWRFWFGILLTSSLEDLDDANKSGQFISHNETFESGSGFLVGLSYKLTQRILLNAEYRMWDYESSYIDGNFVSNFELMELSETAVFISIPFGIY